MKTELELANERILELEEQVKKTYFQYCVSGIFIHCN